MSAERWKYLMINLLSVAALLVLLEVASHHILRRIYNRDFDSSLIVEHKYFSSPGLKENAAGMVWGKPFHTDEYACRKTLKKYSSRLKKWLFIGDSVTEGVGVDDSSVFASIVAQHTDSLNVLNYSLIGYSDADYLNVLLTLFLHDDSSISKVTLFFCLNDVYGSPTGKQLPVMAKPGLKSRLNAFLQQHYATYKLLKLLAFQRSDNYFRYDLQFYTSDNLHFAEAMYNLEKCNLLCRRRGIDMNVVMLPYASQLQGRDADNHTPQEMVRQFCTEYGIGFSDPAGYLSGPEDPATLYLFADEIHFSKKGHLLMAYYLLSQ